MSHFDHCDLDGHLLELLVAVHEEQSVTGAALRLGVTQSAVSHLLDKLRAIVGDPLFVRAGRGIVATERADELVLHARRLLDGLRSFVTAGGFDPARLDTTVTIAANDLQRDMLLPLLLRRLRQQAPGLRLRVIASGVPRADMLRDGSCHVLITPRPPDAPDLLHKRLFEDRYAVFYDAARRQAPRCAADFLAADHVTVVYEPHLAVDLDLVLAERGVLRRFVAMVPSFAGVAALLQGSDMLATLPSLLRVHLLRDLAMAAVPVSCPPMPMYLVWHLRHQADPLHAWLRHQIQDLVPAALAQADVCHATPPARRSPRVLPESASAAGH